jgi:hypothetical protein
MPEFRLPDGFNDLAIFSGWALPTECERSSRRQASPMDEVKTFYQAMAARIDAIFDYLAAQPIKDMSLADENLLLLTLSLQEVAPAVENYRSVAVPDGFDIAAVTMTVVGGTY